MALVIAIASLTLIVAILDDGRKDHVLKPGDPCYDPSSPLPSHNIGTDSCLEYETGRPIRLWIYL